jgi:hypothetical protein
MVAKTVGFRKPTLQKGFAPLAFFAVILNHCKITKVGVDLWKRKITALR